MICSAEYDSFDAIPEAFRPDFENKDGKWKMKPDAIPGAAAVFQPALYANEQRAVGQVKTRNTRIQELESEVELLKNSQATQNEPGAVVLNAKDAATWNELSTMGTPKELKAKLTRAQELEMAERERQIADGAAAVTAAGLNSEPLADWAKVNQGHTFSVKETAVDGKPVKVAMVKVEAEVDGKIKVEEHELLTYAKDKMPGYMYDALTTAPDGTKQKPAPQAQQQSGGGVRMPNMGKSAAADEGRPKADKKPVENFNEARAAKPNPFMPAGK